VKFKVRGRLFAAQLSVFLLSALQSTSRGPCWHFVMMLEYKVVKRSLQFKFLEEQRLLVFGREGES
jgi:hypothetical protein